ncbi:TPA: membrane protein insertion efficiency factor YidD [Klebsiella michiganensis]|uniref:membrane protein insertion efficiency factor YidD n=1 Tax=Klebsiella TaxID=570 RepID=UPI001FD64892|nr:membrane protein insertion efficiency factor YidD [Klebsiella pneumoniae]HDN2672614.1 membrane protein insertion efficiency factor YidD [Klebsiella michiganensis]MCQ8377701.1 membrane protein insertion efficiency factor YidD [Klebsiella pneumoniae]MCQ8491764.1 membrane protein insertion efficiency factor YidD [Klebsiella pneumoniae]MCR4493430.1 membrane protein insertion efficiency factor YidD [Klebsiella pneumoniae]UOR57041.1 membrane protein insertion efficiency factor YidD [Klebsiella pn
MLAWLSIRVIYVYRAIAPDSIRQRCRYHPSCSAYAIACLRRHGFIQGWGLAISRIKRCKPPYGGRDLPPKK